MENDATPRRSSRSRCPAKGVSNGTHVRWRNMSETWRKHYLDLGHCRLAKCTRRLRTANAAQIKELRLSGVSFVAMAVAASSAYGTSKEGGLVDYVRAVLDLGLDPNDAYHEDSAVVLAAYHGYRRPLALLLEANCPLRNFPSRKLLSHPNALFAAVHNGQHSAVELMLSHRPDEALQVIRDEWKSSFWDAVKKGDVETVRLLKSRGCAVVSDRIIKWVYGSTDRIRRLQTALRRLHPHVPNVMHWSRELHWSFPQTDRETLNWFWRAIHRPSAPTFLPDELWLRIFGLVGRGWWACRHYGRIGRASSDIDESNIIVDS